MTRKILAALFVVFALVGASAEYWTDVTERPVVCCDGRTGCQLLQMVMMGSFAQLNPNDSLDTRVMSAVFPMLCEITDDDFTHFCEEFRADEQVVRRLYYIAMGNCLWADILAAAQPEGQLFAARRILLLFLNPEGEENAQEQMDIIRKSLTSDIIKRLADEAALPVDFVEYIVNTEDWRDQGEKVKE